MVADILLLEDIHWADDNSLVILERILERLSEKQLLVVCSTRPGLFETKPEWSKGKEGAKVVYTRINLTSLSHKNSQQLVEAILGKVQGLPESLRDVIVERAEGNPFFIEELIKMLIEDGNAVGIAVDTLSLDFGPSPDFATHYEWLPTGRWGRGRGRRTCPATISTTSRCGWEITCIC